jgi:hypothetical protein
MKTSLLALALSSLGLFWDCSQKQNTPPPATAPAATALLVSEPFAPAEDPTEFDLEIEFEAMVDQLRLRAAPDPNAAVLCEIPEGARLTYLHQSGGQAMQTTLRGVLRKGRWHKVRHSPASGKSQEGWVFAGAVALRRVYGEGEAQIDTLQYDFLKVKKVSKAQFEAQAARYKNDFVDDLAARTWADTTFLLPFDNGKHCVLADTSSWPQFEFESHSYVGYYPSVGLYLLYGEYYGEIFSQWYKLVNKRDGTEQPGFLNGEMIPLLSPDKKWLADSFSADCGSVQAMDFVVNDGKAWRSAFMFQIEGYFAKQMVWGDHSHEIWVEWAEDQYERTGGVGYYKITFDWPF